jgi:hypothetical protein
MKAVVQIHWVGTVVLAPEVNPLPKVEQSRQTPPLIKLVPILQRHLLMAEIQAAPAIQSHTKVAELKVKAPAISEQEKQPSDFPRSNSCSVASQVQAPFRNV